MAGNSSLYELRKQMNESNIKQWQNWSVEINYVVNQFNDIVNNLTDRLETAEMANEGLKYRIFHGESYVKLQYSDITILSAKTQTYTQSCGVFSNKLNNENNTPIYVYSNKTVNGITINGTAIYEKTIGTAYYPFTAIPGSITGTPIIIKTDNAQKITDNIKIVFSHDASIAILENESFPPANTSTRKTMTLKINYATIVSKQLYTVDKSALSKALINQTPIVEKQVNVQKYATPIGQYSTVKTVAATAKLKNSI